MIDRTTPEFKQRRKEILVEMLERAVAELKRGNFTSARDTARTVSDAVHLEFVVGS